MFAHSARQLFYLLFPRIPSSLAAARNSPSDGPQSRLDSAAHAASRPEFQSSKIARVVRHSQGWWIMPTRLLLVLVLAISLTAFAQVSAPPPQYASTPAAPTVVAPSTNGVLTGYGPTGGVLLTTPEATFDSPQPTAGISLAGRAGISNSTPINTAVQSTQNSPTMVYVNLPATGETVSPEVTVNPATSAVSSSSNDLLPSYFSDNIGAAPNPSGLSLAEIAARYRARQAHKPSEPIPTPMCRQKTPVC